MTLSESTSLLRGACPILKIQPNSSPATEPPVTYKAKAEFVAASWACCTTAWIVSPSLRQDSKSRSRPHRALLGVASDAVHTKPTTKSQVKFHWQFRYWRFAILCFGKIQRDTSTTQNDGWDFCVRLSPPAFLPKNLKLRVVSGTRVARGLRA